MYLKELSFKNYGALKNVSYLFQFNSDGTPKPTVFIGKNGVGKTLLLSNIVHSLIEIKRKFYAEISEVKGNNYYRMGSQYYICVNENSAYSRMVYDDNASYTDLMTRDYNKFKASFDANLYAGVDINNQKLKENGFFAKAVKPSSNIFEHEIFLYFPVERYYMPTWVNKENNSSLFMISDGNLVGKSSDSIIKYNLLENIESWILDLSIDQALYESKIVGKNSNIIRSINTLLGRIYENQYSSIRFAITPKQHGYRQIQILGKDKDENEHCIVPKFTNLSSGEIMLLGMMASILKEYDKFSELNSMTFDAISGIVLIDEIDLHLHSDLLKTVLPNLISMFPKMQFIVTSHSPFFLLGMKDKFNGNCNFVTLPTGIITNQIERFDEMERCYAIVDESYKEILNSLNEVRNKLATIEKPLIITEGKTDWKHLSHALSVFHERGEFQNLSLDFLMYEDELGDSKLKTLLENLAKVQQPHKVIGVFDNDTKLGEQYTDIHEFGNNVYACCIKDVKGYKCGISIELLYDRSDLTIRDDDGRRVFLSDEFKEKSHQLKENPQITCTNNAIINAYKTKAVKIIDNGVFDSEEKSLALSKSDFADNVYNRKGQFSNVNVDGFKDIIDTIAKICEEP